MTRGFSLVELLVSLTVCALLAGAVAAAVPPARAVFETTPEVLDQQQRERTMADVLARVVRSAALVHAVNPDGTAGARAPAVELLQPHADGTRFHALRVLSISGVGRGMLAVDQAGPSGALQLQAAVNCPSTGDVCGFTTGVTAVVVDVTGRFEVFAIADTDLAAHALWPSGGLAAAYAAGSEVFEVAWDIYRLDSGSEGSFTLVRETAAGAVQPMVDQVAELAVEGWRVAGWLARVDITARLKARSPVAHRQVPDRTVRVSIALRNRS